MRDKKADRNIGKARQQLKKVHYKAIEDPVDLRDASQSPEDAEKHGTIPWEVIEAERQTKKKPDGS